MPGAPVEISYEDGIATLVLNHPPANAIDIEFCLAIEQALIAAEAADGVRAIILTGYGSIFCAGLNLKTVPTYGGNDQKRMLRALNRMWQRLYALPLPTVAVLNGHAIAGGLVLALACDWRIAVDTNATFGLTEVRAGVPYPQSALAIVQAELAPPTARQLMLGGQNHGPARALELGIVDEVLPMKHLRERGLSVARKLATPPPEGYRRIKHQLRQQAIAQIARAVSGHEPLYDNWLFDNTRVAARRVLAGA